jgi:hypothetical protein
MTKDKKKKGSTPKDEKEDVQVAPFFGGGPSFDDILDWNPDSIFKGFKEIDVGFLDIETPTISHFDTSFLYEDLSKPLPPPDPNLTATDAAVWMKEEVEKKGTLHHAHAVRYIHRHFGERFTIHNERGNRVLTPEVRDAFLKLTKRTVMWASASLYWRMRRPTDKQGRRVRE